MKFTARQEIAVPQARAFQEVGDFDGFERQAAARGATVTRGDAGAPVGTGSSWEITLPIKGVERHFSPEITAWDPPAGYAARSESRGLVISATVVVTALGPDRSALTLDIEVEPRSLPARLIVQSLRLAKGTLDRRLAERFTRFAREIERKVRRAGARNGGGTPGRPPSA